MGTITIGVDLAKQVFAVCSVDAAGRVQDRRELRREASVSGCRRCRPARPWPWRHAAARITGHDAARTTACSRG